MDNENDYPSMEDAVDFGTIESEEVDNPDDITEPDGPDDTQDDSTDPVDPDNQSDDTTDSKPNLNGADTDKEGPEINTDDVELTGIEKYLSEFGVEGGMIKMADGTVSHFDDLTPEKQTAVLTALHDQRYVNDNNGLSDQDAQILAQAQANGLGLSEYIQAVANSQIQAQLQYDNINQLDVDALTDDQVFQAMLVGNDGKELKPEELAQQLADAKALPTFASQVTMMRNQLKADQDYIRSAEMAKQEQEYNQQVADYQQNVVDAVDTIDTFYDVPIDANVKNYVLDNVLSYDEHGNAAFTNAIANDPKELFKAAFLYYYGEDLLKGRDKYWKEQQSKARKAWQTQQSPARNNKTTFINNNKQANNQPTDDYEDDGIMDLSDDIFFQ